MPSAFTKLLLRLCMVCAPFVLLFIAVMLFTPYITEVQKAKVQDKIDRLILQVPNPTQVIIAGDSRAEANIVPALFDGQSGLSSVNIASGNETLHQAYDTLDGNGLLDGRRLLIFSISIYQINDLSNDYQPVDKAVVDEEPWGAQKIKDAVRYWKSYLDYYIDRFKADLRFTQADPVHISKSEIATKGYEEVTAVMKLPRTGEPAPGDPFAPYDKDFRINGVKQRDFIEIIRKLGATDDIVILYLGPLAPIWKTALIGTPSETQNKLFAELIENTAEPYPNVHFINFEAASTTDELPNRDFSDYVHLNTEGARAFTTLLVQTLRSEGLLTKK